MPIDPKEAELKLKNFSEGLRGMASVADDLEGLLDAVLSEARCARSSHEMQLQNTKAFMNECDILRKQIRDLGHVPEV